MEGLRKYVEGLSVRRGEKLSGWLVLVDSQGFRKTDWVTFSERTVVQSCHLVLDS